MFNHLEVTASVPPIKGKGNEIAIRDAEEALCHKTSTGLTFAPFFCRIMFS